MPGKKVVIIGGGFGGVAAARTARKLLNKEHTVILVDRLRRTYLSSSFPWLIIGQRQHRNISRSLGALFQRGINYIQDEVEGIDIGNQIIHTAGNTLHYDYLILATGVEYDWEGVPGSAEAHSFYNLENAQQLRAALRSFNKGRIVISISRLPYKCPPAPYETAMLLDSYFSDRTIRPEIDLHITTPEQTPLAILGPVGTQYLRQELNRRRITIHTEQNLSHVDPKTQTITFFSRETLKYDLLITIPIHRSPKIIRDAQLIDGSGWVNVNPMTLMTEHNNIFAIGDTNFVSMANGAPIPKSGILATSEGVLVGRNVATQIQGGTQESFAGEGYCFIDHGNGKTALINGQFLAAGQPDVTIDYAKASWYRKKVRFETDWRHWKI